MDSDNPHVFTNIPHGIGSAPLRGATGFAGPNYKCSPRFLNSGNGLLKMGELGAHWLSIYMVNMVELHFQIPLPVFSQYQNIKAKQWQGPEGVWVKQGNPITQPWSVVTQDQGQGADDPKPDFVYMKDNLVAYADTPGPSMVAHQHNSRVHVVQNFTGWVEGVPLQGGQPQRICEVVAWYSVVSVLNANWDNADAGVPDWQFMQDTKSGTGWVPAAPPSI